jgi:5-methylcytosine-specific restriction protein A
MQLLSAVLSNYLKTKAELNGKAFNIGSIDQNSLLVELPEFFRSLLEQRGRSEDFKVEGSIGNGNMARVPWVAVFNKTITESAQEGYYIVLLFSEDMRSCFLSFNQGVTAFEHQYSRRLALAKMEEASKRARALNLFVPAAQAQLGKIDLRATGDLGEGYEFGAIESYCYHLIGLPTESEVAENFFSLLNHYDQLVPIAGESLQSLAPISEAEFQQVALDKAASLPVAEVVPTDETSGGIPKPPKKDGLKVGWVRNAKVAAQALARAHFKCEVDPAHQTFISRARRVPYVEAHHLVPMSQQEVFPVSLDVGANVVALCATCHKLLHHGRAADKRDHLVKLLADREERLAAAEILLDKSALLRLYSRDLPDEE